MSTPGAFMTEVLVMWTEPGEAARRKVLDRRFVDGVQFHDPDGTFVGQAGLEEFSASLRARFPDVRFTLASPPQAAGNGFRAFWRFGPPEKPDAVTGMDFVVWDGERASVLYAFVNRPEHG
jgi:SnoaL-like domain